jgi:hypothetical protein
MRSRRQPTRVEPVTSADGGAGDGVALAEDDDANRGVLGLRRAYQPESSRRDSEGLDMAKPLAPKHGGVYLPGIREQLRDDYQREVLRGDPRLFPDLTPDLTSEQRRRANAASPAIRQAEHTLARIDAGEDIEDGRPSARYWPELADVPWYSDPTVRRVIVAADDTVRPIYDLVC